jgi:hypothetical protein
MESGSRATVLLGGVSRHAPLGPFGGAGINVRSKSGAGSGVNSGQLPEIGQTTRLEASETDLNGVLHDDRASVGGHIG